MAQLTVLNPDGSVADVLAISNELALEFTDILENLDRDSLDLALLREIELKVLSAFSQILKEKNIEINNVQEAKSFARSTIYYFSSFLDVIYRIEKLPNPDSLTIFVND